MAVSTGFEPAISSVTGRHVNPYTTRPFGGGDWIRTSDLQVMSLTSYQTALLRDIMADGEGFEPPRRFPHLAVFKTALFSQT